MLVCAIFRRRRPMMWRSRFVYTSGTTARRRNGTADASEPYHFRNERRPCPFARSDRPLADDHAAVSYSRDRRRRAGTARSGRNGHLFAPGFNGPRFLEWLGTSRATWFTAAPSIRQESSPRATERSRAFARDLAIHTVFYAPLPAHVRTSMKEMFGVPVVEAYGMTEAAHQIACNPLPPDAGSRGRWDSRRGPTSRSSTTPE